MEPESIFTPENNSLNADPKIRSGMDWTIWAQWLLATTIGWIIALLVGVEPAFGLVIGLAQWFVLRRYFAQVGGWIVVTALGWAFGWVVITTTFIVPLGTGLISSVFSGALLGLSMGFGQWFLLRRWVNFASMWLLLMLSGWSIALAGFFGSTLVGAVAGAITGFAFDFLLRFPRSDGGQ